MQSRARSSYAEPQPSLAVASSNATAKLGIKKHPMEQSFIGWEFVGVLVGVLPFFGTLVGVFVFLVGVLIPLVGVWWEFLSDLFFLP